MWQSCWYLSPLTNLSSASRNQRFRPAGLQPQDSTMSYRSHLYSGCFTTYLYSETARVKGWRTTQKTLVSVYMLMPDSTAGGSCQFALHSFAPMSHWEKSMYLPQLIPCDFARSSMVVPPFFGMCRKTRRSPAVQLSAFSFAGWPSAPRWAASAAQASCSPALLDLPICRAPGGCLASPASGWPPAGSRRAISPLICIRDIASSSCSAGRQPWPQRSALAAGGHAAAKASSFHIGHLQVG
mmetsp:Transcript_46666/g.149015  ORF Transcript_46666/g.149015 Transcript_46666/m.149015 type:complete len:240 (-) Transcript_46666:55-774(-)